MTNPPANQHAFSPESLRPSQHEVVFGYPNGRMGISAVPGSGKTHTLSFLAADLILSGNLDLHQEVLIVTMSNSAVDNFTQRIGGLIKSEGLIPGMMYRVRTLHGLAHDIVRERPSLVNLANDFSIIDDKEAVAIREQVALAWLRANPGVLDEYLNPELSADKLARLSQKDLPELVQSIGLAFIRSAKDYELTPEALRKKLDELPAPLPLAEMGWAIYQEYQRSLAYRGAVDFDDLIRLALAALRSDPKLVERLREQWPYILEDEAQDSSRLQEEILRILAGPEGNWVRVGDPNQAIYETFTTADPNHLLSFIKAPGTLSKNLPVSGRSTESIISLANYLIHWTREAHPRAEVRDALHPPEIRPTGPGDPQPNPQDAPDWIHFTHKKMTPADELDVVMNSLIRWQVAQNEKLEQERETLVVLDLMNKRGAELAEMLRKRGIEPVEILQTTPSTRYSAGSLTSILRYLSNPQSVSLLARAFHTWLKLDHGGENQPVGKRAVDRMRKVKYIEDYLYPLPDREWLESTGLRESEPPVYELLCSFRELVRRWHGAALLPIDQLLLTLAQDLFSEPAELAIAHKLAGVLRQKANSHPDWRLPNLADELEAVAKNQRRFIGFSDDDSGFEPNRHRGRIVITTMHKAKGQEWDRVYLMSVNNYNFPSGMQYDEYYAEKWYIRDNMNLEAEALEQLKVALSHDEYTWYEEGHATEQSRLDCVRERLRLLFVGITRAKQALSVTWNTGRNGDQQPAIPFLELQRFWEA